MTMLNIEELDEDILSSLRARALAHQISLEEEVRQILRAALNPQRKLGDLALSIFGKDGGVELELENHQPHQPLDFDR